MNRRMFMIPKIIHYCWFGNNEKPAKAKKCIESWKRSCPTYQIIEWNESNFDISRHPYLEWCHNNGKWAYLSDFARLLIIRENGGIYFDTDVELLKSPDHLLCNEAFFGFENEKNVATGLGFGAIPNHKTVNAMIQEYTSLLPDEEGNYPLVTCPALNTKALLSFALQLNGKEQMVEGARILPVDYMNPYDDPTGRLNITDNTFSIHWYSKSWMSKKKVLRSKLTKPFHRIFGVNCFEGIKKK